MPCSATFLHHGRNPGPFRGKSQEILLPKKGAVLDVQSKAQRIAKQGAWMWVS